MNDKDIPTAFQLWLRHGCRDDIPEFRVLVNEQLLAMPALCAATYMPVRHVESLTGNQWGRIMGAKADRERRKRDGD